MDKLDLHKVSQFGSSEFLSALLNKLMSRRFFLFNKVASN